jgi:hypothetical protein
MKLLFPSPEFDDAVAAVCHGLGSDEQVRALNRLLRDNPAAQDEYLFRAELHSRLASETDLFATTASGVSAVELSPLTPACSLDGAEGESESPSILKFPGPRKPVAWAVALAACLVVLAAGFALWLKRPAARGTTSAAVAMLTRAVDARWSQSTGPLRVGSALEPRWLRLESGLAQVVFYSGARVVIEGPTELQLVSPSEAVCPSGRLLAEVPQPARGFRLKTDQFNVVDLGTAFAIDATRARTEVHVFKGRVELLPGTAAKQTLGEGQAAVAQGNAPPRLMVASAAAFTSMFEFQQRSLASEAFRYEQWQFASAQLNQDSSLVVHLDFENLSGTDWTLRNAAEENRSVPETTIVGCQRGEGRWREKQALEFQNVNDRVRLAVPGDFDALTLSAWVCVKGLDRQFNSLFMCDGFEPGTVHWLIRNDGVLGLTVIGPGSGNFQILASPPVLSLDKFGMWLHLAVVLDGKARQVVHYVNGEPVSRHALKLGPPFRLGSAELGNWNARSGPNPAPSLIRNLSGSLDEFELFSRALSDADIRELYAKGKPDV